MRAYIETPIYHLEHYRGRFRIRKTRFLKLRRDLSKYDNNMWRTRIDTTGKNDFRSEVKIIACLRILGTGQSFDIVDESEQMGRQTIQM